MSGERRIPIDAQTVGRHFWNVSIEEQEALSNIAPTATKKMLATKRSSSVVVEIEREDAYGTSP